MSLSEICLELTTIWTPSCCLTSKLQERTQILPVSSMTWLLWFSLLFVFCFTFLHFEFHLGGVVYMKWRLINALCVCMYGCMYVCLLNTFQSSKCGHFPLSLVEHLSFLYLPKTVFSKFNSQHINTRPWQEPQRIVCSTVWCAVRSRIHANICILDFLKRKTEAERQSKTWAAAINFRPSKFQIASKPWVLRYSPKTSITLARLDYENVLKVFNI